MQGKPFAVALAVLAMILAAPPGRAQAPSPFICLADPVLDQDFPDPEVLSDPGQGGMVFAYATNVAGGGGLINVPVSRSQDVELAHWSPPAEALPRLPAWARPGFTWAPAVAHRPGGPYRLYFVARYGFSGRQCVGAAVSASPDGPFTPTDEVKPLVCTLGQGGTIDPSVFRDDDGAEYLLWKTDANCCDGDPAIYLQKLAPDGLSLVGPHPGETPWLTPDATLLILRDLPWEGRVIEAPSLVKHDGRYVLFYSANDYDSGDYAVGYATAPMLAGPYRKAQAPILTAGTSGLEGPGGANVFTGSDGVSRIAFHAWRGEADHRRRALFLGRVEWRDGVPNVVTACAAAPGEEPPF